MELVIKVKINIRLKVVSLNVAGLINLIKQKRLARALKVEGADLVSLQETHVRAGEEDYLKCISSGSLYHALVPTRT